ncbi:alcohol dehydrogenase catalytic domain-containing protein [Paractinoplanes maris]|uniref:alcohol dehydrogenase catalytic domain-containing protein n=1 Tax=Paractinoplanes maris TaxID=1734446 RepID=UPI0034DAC8A8
MAQLGADQIVVRNHAVAVNPLDWVIQVAGRVAYAWLKYPAVLRTDLAGEVVEAGSAVTRFRPGDRALTLAATPTARPGCLPALRGRPRGSRGADPGRPVLRRRRGAAARRLGRGLLALPVQPSRPAAPGRRRPADR